MNDQYLTTRVVAPTVQHIAARDDEFASRTGTGSPFSLADLHSTHSRRLYRTILAITKNLDDAEDALQETFLRAWRAMHTFEGRSTVYSWLTRIAINTALEMLRTRRARGEQSIDSQLDNDGNLVCLEVRDPNPDPEQLYHLRQRRMGLQKAIKKLDRSLREPIQLRLMNESSLKEIGRTLNISEGAVKVRLHRARLRLSSAWENA